VGETLQLLEATARSVSLPEILAHPAIGISALPAGLCMGLLLAWFISPTRRQRFWPFLLVATAVLALGPYLSPEMEASDSWVILPYGLLQSVVPFLSRLHQPDQMLILFALSQAMMVALLWTAVRPRIAIHPRWVALCAMIAALWSVPRIMGATPMAFHRYSPPAWVSQLGESGAVIEIPMGWSEASVLYQALHGHPVTGGPGVASQMFDSTDYRNLFETRPELAFFWSPAQTELTEAHISSLLESGAGYVAVHHAAMTSLTKDPADYRTWALENVASRVHTALGPPVYGDDEVRLYRIRAGVVPAAADVVDGGTANEGDGME